MAILHSRRARAAAASLLAGGLLAATATAAHASSSITVQYDSQAHWITATYDGMNLAVADASTAPGAPVIQWYNTGGAEQKWYFDSVYDASDGVHGYQLRNENSGMCLFNDGIAGDWMYQEPCDPSNWAELFYRIDPNGTDNTFEGLLYGLDLDVNGYSYGAGANIIGWYNNKQFNQDFWVTNVSS